MSNLQSRNFDSYRYVGNTDPNNSILHSTIFLNLDHKSTYYYILLYCFYLFIHRYASL